MAACAEPDSSTSVAEAAVPAGSPGASSWALLCLDLGNRTSQEVEGVDH